MFEFELEINWRERLNEISSTVETALERYLDVEVSEIEQYVGENNERVWATRGSNIGASWATDLVQTGRLRDSMTSPTVFIRDGEIRWVSDVSYAPAVNQRATVYGADDELIERILEGFAEWFEREFNEKS